MAAIATTAPTHSQPSDKGTAAGGPAATFASVRPEANVAPSSAPVDVAVRGVERSDGPSPLIAVSVALLLAGIVLGLLRLAARRLV
jgi:hypothetical protein